jgi:hypothetical protein
MASSAGNLGTVFLGRLMRSKFSHNAHNPLLCVALVAEPNACMVTSNTLQLGLDHAASKSCRKYGIASAIRQLDNVPYGIRCSTA